MVRAYQTGGYDGIGFVLSDAVDENGLTIAAIDIDKVSGDPKRIARAKEIIEAIGSYTEISPSAKGLRVFLKAKPLSALWRMTALNSTRASGAISPSPAMSKAAA